MLVDRELCTGCGRCVRVCPGEALSLEWEDGRPVAVMDRDLCFECGVCVRSGVCPVSAFRTEESLPWPRVLRSIMSDPMTVFEATGINGRGTEEMKTNDVTGRFKPGVYGLCVDVGRPVVGARLGDVQVITRILAEKGVGFAEENPITSLMEDPGAGCLFEDVLGERVLSAVVEGFVEPQQLSTVLAELQAAVGRVEAMFSVGVIARVEDDEHLGLLMRDVRGCGVGEITNVKTNVGLGRSGG